jgi:phosphatidylserine decarboxylase
MRPRPILLEAWAVLVITAGAAVAFVLLGYLWLSGIAVILTLFVLWFFRNPERTIPQGRKEVVSPADGRVVEISKVYEDRLLQSEAIKIGIFMSPLDVHVNRIPYEGKIVIIRHQPGKFLSAFKPNAPLENEQNAILLEMPGGKRILFVQIAGLLARRIVYWVHEGEQVQKGQRFGMIKFGSRMDLYLPPTTRVCVKPAEKVKAGATLMGILE